MRADKDWEDSLGKKLHDFEGELSPLAWSKIKKEIQPSRHRWLFWLPLFLLIVVPGGMYLTKFNYPQTMEAGNPVANLNGKATEPVASQIPKAGLPPNKFNTE